MDPVCQGLRMRAVPCSLVPQHLNMPRYLAPQCNTSEWRQISQIPSKTIRDLASIIACPQLLQTSSELPLVPDAVFGTRCAGWERSLDWLQSLDPAEVDAWFDVKQRTRLGYRFADCVEYNLRLSPFFCPPCLHVSQQVFQRTARNPVIPFDSSAAKERLPAEPQVESENEEASEGGCDAFRDRADYGLFNLLSEAIQGDEGASGESFDRKEDGLVSERIDGVSSEEGMRDSLPVGRKKSRRLQRKAAKQTGKTVTVGEFDILFLQEQSPATGGRDLPSTGPQADQEAQSICAMGKLTGHESDGAESNEKVVGVEHWELSVKFLLYIGPPKRLLEELGRPELVVSLEQNDICSGVLEDGRSGNKCADQHERGSEASKCEERERESRQERCKAQNEASSSQEEDLLYDFVGPHAGERLTDRKDRIAKQLRLSDDPLAKQVLEDLFLKPSELKGSKSDSDSHSSEVGSRSTSREERQSNQAETAGKAEPSNPKLSLGYQDPIEREAEARNAELLGIEVTPRAFVKGYLFYEHQLWKVLAERGQVKASAIEQESAVNFSPSLEASKALGNLDTSSNSLVGLGTNLDVPLEAFVEATRAEAAQTGPSTSSKSHLQNGACLEAPAAILDTLESPTDATAAVPQKARLNPSHWIGWWTRDIRAFLEDPIFSSSRWYIIPKMEWLSPVVVRHSTEAPSSAVQSFTVVSRKDQSNGRPPLSNKCTSTALTPLEQDAADRQVAVQDGTNGRDQFSATSVAAEPTSKSLVNDIDALSSLGARSGEQSSLIEQASQMLTSAELLSKIETLHAVAKRCNVPRRGRILVAELQWESTDGAEDGDSKVGKEKGTEGGAWLEVSRGFVVESTWPETGELPCIMLS